MRKLFIVAAVTGALLIGIALGRASATTTLTTDAEWWRSLTPESQTYVVEGATDAYENGYSNGIVDGEAFVALSLNLSTAQQQALWKKVPVLQAAFSKTFGTYVHQIGDFYDNHPAAGTLTIGAVLECLADNRKQPYIPCDDLAKPAPTP